MRGPFDSGARQPGLDPAWFVPCVQIDRDFDHRQLGRIVLVAPLSNEAAQSPAGSFYIWDGGASLLGRGKEGRPGRDRMPSGRGSAGHAAAREIVARPSEPASPEKAAKRYGRFLACPLSSSCGANSAELQRYTDVASRATRFRRWLAQLLDYVLLHGTRLP